jgi:prolyl-tRNA editing enzyme YbaK/EbsC (Cys-tRNA(Pro) deacylase)
MPTGAERFAAATAPLGLAAVRMPDSTHTAAEAAAAAGCAVGAIVKSLVFVIVDGEQRTPLLALVAGDRRADLQALAAVVGAPVEKADATTVKAATGYSIGGVPPIGHPAPIRTIVDESLMRFSEVWSAAGDSQTVFAADPHQLTSWAGGELAAISTPG